MTKDQARKEYNKLPVTSSPEDFVKGQGNWSLTEKEFRQATKLAKLITSKEKPMDPEYSYKTSLFDYLGKENVQHAYILPVMDRLIKAGKRDPHGSVAYETAYKALKRGVKEMAEHWKMEHVMTTGLSKAAKDRIQDDVTRTVMEIYFIRRKEATGIKIPQRP